MDKTIYNRRISDYQLIKTGIELAHTVMALCDCDPRMEANVHYMKAKELAMKWNDSFIDAYISKEGE